MDTDTLFVDATNNRVGIGTVSPSANLHVKSTGTVLNYVETTSTNGRVLSQFKSPVAYFDMRAHGSGFTSETWFGVNSANALVLSSFGGPFLLGTYDSQNLTLGTNNTSRAVVFGSTGNIAINTTTDAGQKLQVSGKVFIKGTTSLTATKVFEVQNGAGESIMDFRDSTYAFFGCGQGGGSATGFIFNYSNTSYCQFSGYNYGAGAGAYKPILLDTDIVGRGNGVFVNFGVSTNPPPDSDTEFGVRGRTADTTSFIARFRNSSNTDMFEIRADGALFTNTLQGYSGTLSIPGNPPGSTTITITNGLITNIA